MLSFKEWLNTTDYRTYVRSEKGRFVNDIIDDEDFPKACEKYVMYKYFNNDKHLIMFEELYSEYIRYISRRFSDESVLDYD